jgi:hypothetical protein
MSYHTRRLVFVAALAIALFVPRGSSGQVEIDNNFKYNSGQDIQPIFEGWSHTPDGGFMMHFGYLNRNYAQELSVPVGPGNNVEPGGPDRGQPGFFYTRTNRNVFTVKVAKDWGKKELVWTVTANGKTQKAIGWLQPEWEIDPIGGASAGGRVDPERAKNTPPTLKVPAALSVAMPNTLAVTAAVADDGLPKPAAAAARRGGPAIGQETPPLLRGGTADVPTNVPSVAAGAGGAGAGAAAGGAGRGAAAQGPTVSWMLWRGPANVNFSSRAPAVKDGQAQITVTFNKPGEYVLRARASDRVLTTVGDVKVTVK